MYSGTIRPKNINVQRIDRMGDSGTYKYLQSEPDAFEMRGICYETDPVKLQEIMDEADRKREALCRKLKYGR
jgi:hypothetical protein